MEIVSQGEDAMLKGIMSEVRVYSCLNTFSKRLWGSVFVNCSQENSTKLSDAGRGPDGSPLSSIPKKGMLRGVNLPKPPLRQSWGRQPVELRNARYGEFASCPLPCKWRTSLESGDVY